MGRLTARTETGSAYIKGRNNRMKYPSAKAASYAVIDRLTEYEDTGMTPEDIKQVQDAVNPMPFARFREIMQAEKEGRCQVLPIKPNTEFFYIDKGEVKSAILAIYEIGHLAIFFWGVGITKRFTALIFESGKSDIGKTIFLTRPKAEAALERR
jgi:hypothetical protein